MANSEIISAWSYMIVFLHLRKTQFQTFLLLLYTLYLGIPTNKGANSYKLNISEELV